MANQGIPKTQPNEQSLAGEAAKPQLPTQAPNFWQRTFIALQYRNYRLWFIGQLVSLIGTWMQITAQGFLVFELTQSPASRPYCSCCLEA